jgi:hypothetical protein
MERRYRQIVANFPLEREVTIPFGGDWDLMMCKFETLFKEISNGSLTAKQAL